MTSDDVLTPTGFNGTALILPTEGSALDAHHSLEQSYTPAFKKVYGYQE